MRYAVRERIFSIGDDFWITDDQGGKAFLVGGILDHEFEIRPDGGGQPLARISRAWFSMRDRYGVDVAPGLDDALHDRGRKVPHSAPY